MGRPHYQSKPGDLPSFIKSHIELSGEKRSINRFLPENNPFISVESAVLIHVFTEDEAKRYFL
jgi:hypothetical protein